MIWQRMGKWFEETPTHRVCAVRVNGAMQYEAWRREGPELLAARLATRAEAERICEGDRGEKIDNSCEGA